MATKRRQLKTTNEIKINPGPYIGYVKNASDVNRMGRLFVHIPELHGEFDETAKDIRTQTTAVQYCSPFAGQTPVRDTTRGTKEFANTQKSYGFWMVPPDIDTKVLVMFANGDPSRGYWMGCVFEDYMNHMTPGIATSSSYTGNEEQLEKYQDPNTGLGLTSVPVAEAQRRAETDATIRVNTKLDKDDAYQTKPVHPPATETLIKQGLIQDSVRGTTSSSARRETPSQVFGISTPGPIDFEGQTTGLKQSINRHGKIWNDYPTKELKAASSRLGGHQFVMDDGTPAIYDAKDGKGKITSIDNELIRLRTRSGAQVLLHNSKDLVYIVNNTGTAWIEFTQDGKIDVYANDSVSIHTQNDMNFRAERDVNIEAGRNVNIKATGQNEEEFLINSDKLKTTGRVHIDGVNIDMIARKVTDKDENEIGGDIKIKAENDYKLYASANGKIEVGTNFDLYAGTDFLANAGSEVHINTAGKVVADHVGESVVSSLRTWKNVGVNQTESIMMRVPTAEPYAEHENKRKDKTTPTTTDREQEPPEGGEYLDKREIV